MSQLRGLLPMSVDGPSRTSRDVCFSAAVGGEADMSVVPFIGAAEKVKKSTPSEGRGAAGLEMMVGKKFYATRSEPAPTSPRSADLRAPPHRAAIFCFS
jgi:hypothetical protein